MNYTLSEADALAGRVLTVAQEPYTVTSASTYGQVNVWNPRTQTLMMFDSRATFEHWAYGTAVPSAGDLREAAVKLAGLGGAR